MLCLYICVYIYTHTHLQLDIYVDTHILRIEITLYLKNIYTSFRRWAAHTTVNFPWQFALSCSQVTVATIHHHQLSMFWMPGSAGMARKDGVSEVPGVLSLLCSYPAVWPSASNFSWLCAYPISEMKIMILPSFLSALKLTVANRAFIIKY